MRGLPFLLVALTACSHKPAAPASDELAQRRALPMSSVRGADPAPPRGPRVAISFDDLGVSEASSEPVLSMKILHALREAQAPSAVFANCKALEPQALLLWQRAGATIGNHTATHLSIDDAKTGSGASANEQWWQDVTSCHRTLAQALGAPVRYFRFPYLRYGTGEERRRSAAQKLTSLGYQVAHVTAATSEWLLAQYYEVASSNADVALAAELAQAYVEHMQGTLEVARQLARHKLRRDVAHITLLHVNRLAADHLPAVLSALRRSGWSFISLQDALADPVYALPDAYSGGCGCSWLARVEPALKPTDEYAFGDYEDALRARFEQRVQALAAP